MLSIDGLSYHNALLYSYVEGSNYIIYGKPKVYTYDYLIII